MEWYVIVLIACAGFMLLQALISFILGDIDFDTNLDLELGDILSFKGLLHFCLGSSLTLTVFGGTTTVNIILAITVGLAFGLGLGWTYKYLYKKLSQEIKYTGDIVNCDAEIYYWSNELQRGEVFVSLEGRTSLIPIQNSKDKITLVPGEKIKVSGTRDLVYKSN